MSTRRPLGAVSPRVRTARRWTRGEPQGGRQGSRPKAERKFHARATARRRCARPFCRRLRCEEATRVSSSSLGRLRRQAPSRRRHPLAVSAEAWRPGGRQSCPRIGPSVAFSTVSGRSSVIAVCGALLSAIGASLSWGDTRPRAWLDPAEPCILRGMPVAGLALSHSSNATGGLAGFAVPGKSVKLPERFP